MKIEDIKKYRGYLPIKSEKEETIKWMIKLIGEQWGNILWLKKYGNNYIVRYRFGNKNVAQIYLKNKSWKEISINIWLKFTQLDSNCLDESCWQWIYNERKNLNIKSKKTTFIKPINDILQI